MAKESVASEGRVFHTLDALRGVAAIGVVIFHMGSAFAPFKAPGGYLAVDLFFVMSGVVLSHAYEARFAAGMGTFDFLRARLIRLYPLYLLGTLLGIAVTLASLFGQNSQHWDMARLLKDAALGLVFIPDFFTGTENQIFPLNIPCWSLFFEILVNFLFVVLSQRLTTPRLFAICLLFGGAVGLAVFNQGNLDQGSTPATFAVGLARTVFGFSVGVLLARRIRYAHRSESSLAALLIVAVIGTAIIGSPQGQWRAIWDVLFVLLIFPVTVHFATRFDPGTGLRALATFLGVTSYAIYVTHSPLSSILNSVTRHFSSDGRSNIGAPYLGIASLVALLAGCWVLDRYFDTPVRRLLNRIIPKIQALRPAALR